MVSTRVPHGPDTRFPLEVEQVAESVQRRRDQYHSARWCARQAMHRLGIEQHEVLKGADGAPAWPPDTVGSMTHCEGFSAAILSLASSGYQSLGIDAEPNIPLPKVVSDLIVNEGDRDAREVLSLAPHIAADRLLFSIKECALKAWYPLEVTPLDLSHITADIVGNNAWSADVFFHVGAKRRRIIAFMACGAFRTERL